MSNHTNYGFHKDIDMSFSNEIALIILNEGRFMLLNATSMSVICSDGLSSNKILRG